MTVLGETRFVERPAGRMEVFTARPETAGPLPVVVLLMDMWGYRQALRTIAMQVAARGYQVLLPDVYYQTDPVRLDAEAAGIEVSRFMDIPPPVQRRLRSAMDSLEDDAVVDDFAALLLAAEDWRVAMTAHAGVVGYCMGGRHALCIAGEFPQRVKASACLHGTALIQEGAKSAHLRALRAAGEIYIGHAGLDEYAPADVPQRLDAALAAGQAKATSVVHASAHHGYALQDRAIHDPAATARDWHGIEAMFRRQLQFA
jgi:carboxymethylenebutenolidase